MEYSLNHAHASNAASIREMMRTRGLTRMQIAAILVMVMGAVLFLAGLFSGTRSIDSFPLFTGEKSGNARYEAIFLDGPYAEETKDGKTSAYFYLAYDQNLDAVLVKTGLKTDLPVYGEDINRLDIPKLVPQTISGEGKQISIKLIRCITDDMTMAEFQEEFGSYYLDTQADTSLTIVLVFGGIILLAGVLIFIAEMRNRRKQDAALKKLEAEGWIDKLSADTLYEAPFCSRKLHLLITDHYVVQTSYRNIPARILSLAGMNNVFLCKMVNGEPTSDSYIAIETDTQRHLLGACAQPKTEFYQAIEKLKRQIALNRAAAPDTQSDPDAE